MNIEDIRIKGVENVVITTRTNHGLCDLKLLLPDDASCEIVQKENPITKRGQFFLNVFKYDGITITKYNNKENSMKINICKKELDLSKLNEKIQEFEAKTNQIPYVFMSEETCEAVKKLCLPPFSLDKTISIEDIDKMPKSKGEYPYIDEYIVVYKGTEVYKDDTLAFGEIELR